MRGVQPSTGVVVGPLAVATAGPLIPGAVPFPPRTDAEVDAPCAKTGGADATLPPIQGREAEEEPECRCGREETKGAEAEVDDESGGTNGRGAGVDREGADTCGGR